MFSSLGARDTKHKSTSTRTGSTKHSGPECGECCPLSSEYYNPRWPRSSKKLVQDIISRKVPYRSMSGKCPSKGPGTPYTKQQAPSTGSSSAVLDENGEHHAHSTEHTAPSTEHRAAAAQQRRAQHRAPKQQQQHEHQAHSSNWGAYTITTNYKKNIFSQAHRRQHPTTSTPSAPTHGLSSGATAS